MEKMIEEIKQYVSFKDTTEAGDIVLVFTQNPQALIYGLVTNIERDKSRRDEWWLVDIHLLTIPPQPLSWILREPQFTGQEIFTMGGEKRFIKAVDFSKNGHRASDGKKEQDPTRFERKRKLKLVK